MPSASMQRMNKTQNINFKWSKRLGCHQFNLLNVGTNLANCRHSHKSKSIYPASGLATCHITHWHRPDKGGSSLQQRDVSLCAGAEVSFCCRESGGPPNDFVPSMLIEFFCSEDSKLSTPASPVRVAIASGFTAQKDSVPQIAVGNGQPSKSKPDV